MKQRLLCAVICIISLLILPVKVSAADYDTVNVDIPVYGDWLTVRQLVPTHAYTIVMETVTDLSPKPVQNTLSMNEGEQVSFKVPVDQPGTFVYKVYAEDRHYEHVVRDKSVYEVFIYSEPAGGTKLITAVSIRRNMDEKPEMMSFDDNSTDVPPPGHDPDPVVTVMTVTEPVPGTKPTEKPPVPEDQKDPEAGLENDEDLIEDVPETEAVTSAETEPSEETPEEEKSPIEIIVDSLITPKTGNITVGAILAVMGISLAAVLAARRKDDRNK